MPSMRQMGFCSGILNNQPALYTETSSLCPKNLAFVLSVTGATSRFRRNLAD
jgi:hypothetical protein